jgi:hypothetical protein
MGLWRHAAPQRRGRVRASPSASRQPGESAGKSFQRAVVKIGLGRGAALHERVEKGHGVGVDHAQRVGLRRLVALRAKCSA